MQAGHHEPPQRFAAPVGKRRLARVRVGQRQYEWGDTAGSDIALRQRVFDGGEERRVFQYGQRVAAAPGELLRRKDQAVREVAATASRAVRFRQRHRLPDHSMPGLRHEEKLLHRRGLGRIIEYPRFNLLHLPLRQHARGDEERLKTPALFRRLLLLHIGIDMLIRL